MLLAVAGRCQPARMQEHMPKVISHHRSRCLISLPNMVALEEFYSIDCAHHLDGGGRIYMMCANKHMAHALLKLELFALSNFLRASAEGAAQALSWGTNSPGASLAGPKHAPGGAAAANGLVA